MQKLWEFLLDSANRDVLAWLGGGVVVAAGLTLKFYSASKAKDQKPKEGVPSAPQNVTASSGGFAAGRDNAGNVVIQNSNGAPAKKK